MRTATVQKVLAVLMVLLAAALAFTHLESVYQHSVICPWRQRLTSRLTVLRLQVPPTPARTLRSVDETPSRQ